MEDVKSGRIHGIVVKDFSYLGRNHIEVGNYIEKIFPLLVIRFIAINNHFDSADYIATTPDMDVTFVNLMYDYFSEENSIKIKNNLFHKRMRGKYIASFAPYGYKKSPEDHNKIVIEYAKKKGIAKHWKYERKKILEQLHYRPDIKKSYSYRKYCLSKKEVVEVSSKRTICLPQDEWESCENTHDGIISKKRFEWVNSKNFKISEQKTKNIIPWYTVK